MDSFIEYDAGTILFNLVMLPPADDRKKSWHLSILKRRFYEWEQRMIRLEQVKPWNGTKNEIIGPDEWTKAIFEVFWNECLRNIPNLGISSFSRAPYE